MEVRIRLFGSGSGQSEVSLSVSPTGEFAAVKQDGGPEQERALAGLIEVVERELRAGLHLLCDR